MDMTAREVMVDWFPRSAIEPSDCCLLPKKRIAFSIALSTLSFWNGFPVGTSVSFFCANADPDSQIEEMAKKQIAAKRGKEFIFLSSFA